MNPQGWAPSLEALGVSPVDGKKGTENRSPWEVGLLTSQWGVNREFSSSRVRDCGADSSLSQNTCFIFDCAGSLAAPGPSLVAGCRLRVAAAPLVAERRL